MVNPCCMSLQKGVKILAVIDMVLCTVQVGLLLLVLGFGISLIASGQIDNDNNDGVAAIIIFVVAGVIAFFQLLLAVMLYRGAQQRKYRLCRNWLIITGVLLTLNIVNFIFGGFFSSVNSSRVGQAIIGFLYTFYQMWVVLAFLHELENPPSTNHTETIVVACPEPQQTYTYYNQPYNYTQNDPPPSYFSTQQKGQTESAYPTPTEVKQPI